MNKKHREIQFFKFPTRNFKTTKKLGIFRDQNDLFLNRYHSPTHKRGHRNSVQSTAFEKYLKQIDEIFSPSHKRNLFKDAHKMHSTNKINTINFKSGLHKKLLEKKEEEKNEPYKEISSPKNIYRKLYSQNFNKKFQKYNSISNKSNIYFNNEIKKFDSINYKNVKKINFLCNNNNIIVKKESKKKELTKIKENKDDKENKETNKEEKKNNAVNEDKEKSDNITNNKKKKFFCCL